MRRKCRAASRRVRGIGTRPEPAIARIAQSLAPGGFLFLGHAETLRGISDAFHLRHTHETFYYQRKAHLPHSVAGPISIVASVFGAVAPDVASNSPLNTE